MPAEEALLVVFLADLRLIRLHGEPDVHMADAAGVAPPVDPVRERGGLDGARRSRPADEDVAEHFGLRMHGQLEPRLAREEDEQRGGENGHAPTGFVWQRWQSAVGNATVPWQAPQ